MSDNNSQTFEDVEVTVNSKSLHSDEEQHDMKPKYNEEEDMMMPQSPSKLLSSSLKRSSLSSSTSSLLSQSSPSKRAKTIEDINVDTTATTTGCNPPSSEYTTAAPTAKDTS